MGKKQREQMVVPQELEVQVIEADVPKDVAEEIEQVKAELKPFQKQNRAYPHFLRRSM